MDLALNNLQWLICHKTKLLVQIRVDLGAMAIKGYSIIPQSSRTGVSSLDGLVSYSRHSLGWGS